jgi:ethanolamine utilization protein EutN
MRSGIVTGSVWATRRVPRIPGGAFLTIEVDDGSTLIALDTLGSGVGERVLVTEGSSAAAFFDGDRPPIDALVIGSIDEAPAPADAS